MAKTKQNSQQVVITTRDALFVAVFMVATSIIATSLTRDWRTSSKASALPPQEEVVQTIEPSLRLHVSSENVHAGEKISVTIYITTNGNQTVATDILVEFPPNSGAMDEKHVKLLAGYKAYNVTQLSPGKVLLSFFVRSELGQKEVSFTKDTALATFEFTVGHGATRTIPVNLSLKPEGSDTSGIYKRGVGDELENILQKVEGVTLTVVQ